MWVAGAPWIVRERKRRRAHRAGHIYMVGLRRVANPGVGLESRVQYSAAQAYCSLYALLYPGGVGAAGGRDGGLGYTVPHPRLPWELVA